MQLTNVVPFLVEDELKRLGGRFEKAANWGDKGRGLRHRGRARFFV